ncbi:AraC family transcriptional regulator [uncultured Roseobacter sp.]|uniref:AraC family transcriptional regulator n=1 Tax=uncultured Roseobacter sp. TaxID=114847 RepID=UPI002634634C|nr:AraC family transcriptional regulator [uncultured Roseobacter sp.]
MDWLVANYKRQDFSRHSHSEYVIGIIESGKHDVWCRGSWWQAGRNAIATLSPDEPHFGRAGSELGWSQTMFYIPEESVRDIFDADDKNVRSGIAFDSPFHECSLIYSKLCLLRDILGRNRDPLCAEELFQDILKTVFAAFGSLTTTEARSVSGADNRIREYLHDNHAQRISLDQLCNLSCSSKQMVIANFKRRFGMTPFQYLQNVRVMKARDLLRSGCGLAEVSAATGFSDQSHLSRNFKAVLGVTPGQYSVVFQ